MGDNFDKTETGETLEQGFNEAGNIAAEGMEAAKRISDKKIKTLKVLKIILPDKEINPKVQMVQPLKGMNHLKRK